MASTAESARIWALANFGEVELGHKSRTRRLCKLAACLTLQPSGTLPVVFHDAAQTKAAYNLLARPEATHAAIISAHCGATRQACDGPHEYLLIEDTTTLDFSTHGATSGIGRIGDDGGSGFLVHTTLALRLIDGEPEVVGVYSQQPWVRGDNLGSTRESSHARKKRPRESQRWAREIERPPHSSRHIYIADAESDIFHVLQELPRRGVELIVRACQPRALYEEEEGLASIFDAVDRQAALGGYEVKLRARPGQAARAAKLEVRSRQVEIKPPLYWPDKHSPLSLWLVDAREIGAPDDVEEPIHWRLLTSLPAADLDSALGVIARYTHRWLIEEYHKCLKTGCGIEQSQLTQYHKLEALLGVLAVVASQLLGMKCFARSRGDEEVPKGVLSELALKLLEAKTPARKRPAGSWTWHTLVIAIAIQGGFMARKSDGLPGWQTLWKGWQNLRLWEEGAEIALTIHRQSG